LEWLGELAGDRDSVAHDNEVQIARQRVETQISRTYEMVELVCFVLKK
jgi:hypothetical protein